MRIITLDLGVSTGYTIGDDKGNVTEHGVKKFKRDKRPDVDSRFGEFHDWLTGIAWDTIIPTETLVVCEQANHMPSISGTRIHFGFAAIVNIVVDRLWQTFTLNIVPAKSIKKFFTGTGNADKDLMIYTAQQIHPDVKDDNEVDSLALYYYTLEDINGKDNTENA